MSDDPIVKPATPASAPPERRVVGPHETRDLHTVLIDRVRDYAIFALDPQGYILTWNEGAQRLKGYTVDEIIGQHFSIFYPEDLRTAQRPARALDLAAANGQVEDEGWRVRKDGSRFWASVLITALRDDDGTLLGFAKVTRDLTEQRQSIEALRRSEERFRLLVESVKDYAIFMLDPTGHIATWNEGARRIKGYTEAEIVGSHFSRFYPAEDLAAGKPERELEIAIRVGEYKEEGWRVRKDGSLFWASVVITAVRDSRNRLAGFSKVTRDLTERRAAQERALEDARRFANEEVARLAAERHSHDLRHLAEQLRASAGELERRSSEAEAANRVKGEFLAAMSHELRTPLNAIGGYAQLLQLGVSGPVTPQQVEHLERIQRSQAHLLGIINDILNFTRIEAGQIEYDTAPIPMREVVDAVTPMVTPQARLKRIHLNVGTCSSAIVAAADRAKVEQILLNLLSNAVKFTPDAGVIEMTCGNEDAHVWLSVRDTGIGIPADQLEAIFTPFVQVGRTLASPKEGTGLGLSISRQLARGMHGDLVASSSPGAGATLTLTLPRAANPSASGWPE
jgi:PAS domain S-box-containing protein